MPEEKLLSVDEFAARIKNKYPVYADMDNFELTEKILAKYPQYSSRVELKKKEDTGEDLQPLSQDSGIGTPPPSETPTELTPEQQKEARHALYENAPTGMALGAGIWESAMNVATSQVPAAIDIRNARTFRDAMLSHAEELEGLRGMKDTDHIEVSTEEYLPTPTGGTVKSPKTRTTTVGQRRRDLLNKIDQNTQDFQKFLQQASEAYEKGSNQMLVQDFRDIGSVDDLINYIGTGIGNAVAQMPLALVSGGASSFLLESGLTYLEGIYEKAKNTNQTIEQVMAKGEDDAVIADALGAVSAGLDVIGAGAVAKNLLEKVGKEGFKKIIKKAMTSSASIEGGTETVQSLINQLSVQLQNDVPFGEAVKNLKVMDAFNEGLLGAIGGGVLGGLGASSRAGVQQETVTDQQQDAKVVTQETGEVRQEERTQEGERGVQPVRVREPSEVGEETQEVKKPVQQKEEFTEREQEEKPEQKQPIEPNKDIPVEKTSEPQEGDKISVPSKYDSSKIFEYTFKDGKWNFTDDQGNLQEAKYENDKITDIFKQNQSTIQNRELQIKGRDKIARGLDKIAQLAGARKNIIEDPDVSWESAIKDIAEGLIEEGIVTAENVSQKVRDYFRDNKIDVPEEEINKVYPVGEEKPPVTPTVEEKQAEPPSKKESQFWANKFKDNPNINPKIIEGISEKGRSYIPINMDIKAEEAKSLVEMKGVDIAKSDFLDDSNRITPPSRVKLGLEIIKKADKLSKEADTEEEANRYTDIAIEVEERGREIATTFGQTVKAFDDPELNSPRKRRRKIFKSRQAITNRELVKIENYQQDKENLTAEFADIINQAIEGEFKRQQTAIEAALQKSNVSKKVKNRIARINTALDGLLADLDSSANASAFFGLDHAVYKGAIQTIKVAINSNPGIKIHEAIQAGIEYIKSKTQSFDEDEFRKKLTEKLEPAFKDSTPKVTSKNVREIAKKHFFEKNPVASTLESKFMAELGIPEQQAKNLAMGITQGFNKIANQKKNEWVNKYFKSNDSKTSKKVKTAFNKLIKLARSGTLTNEEFDNTILEKLGYPNYTTDQKREITRLTNELDKLGVNRKNLISELKKSENPKEDAKKIVDIEREILFNSEKLHDITTLPLSFTSMWQSAIQGNLLTLASLANNVYSNMVSQPLRFVESLVASPIDIIGSKIFKRERKISIPLLRKTLTFGPWERSIFLGEAQLGYADGFGKGSKEGLRQFKSGISEIDLEDYDVKRSMRPWKSLMSAIQKYKKERRVDWRDATEALIGASPEAMFRSLNLGDKPFRRAGEYSKLYQEAAKRGYKRGSSEWYEFLMKPDETTKNLAEEAGKEKTFQGDTFAGTSAQRFINTIRNLPDNFNSSKFAKKSGARVPDALASGWKVFWTFTVPYAKTPVNILVDAAELAIPALSGGKAFHYMSIGKKDKAIKYIGRFVVAMAIRQMVKWLDDDDAINGISNKTNAKIRNMQYAVDYPNHINFSALARKMSGGDGKPKENDIWLNYERWGPLGIALSVQASKIQDEEYRQYVEQEDSWLKNFGDMIMDTMKSSVLMGQMSFEQSFLYGTNQTLEALKGDRSANNYLTSITFAMMSPILPNNLFTLSRASRDNMVVVKDSKLGKQFVNELKQRTFQSQDLPTKIDMWGDPIKQTPEGRNAWWYAVDPTKYKTIDIDSRTYKIFEIFNKTGDTDVIPSVPSNKFKFNGETYELDNKQYEKYLIMIGKKRAMLFDAFISSDISETPEKIKAKIVKSAYNDGLELGKLDFLMNEGFLTVK